ncbi:DSD1 family PLP-dependent enzyme, partial [Singulisphaera rosea]
RFAGVMGYEGHTLMIADPEEKRAAIAQAIGRLLEAKEQVEEAGLPCPIVSAGGTGSYQISADIPGLTELQAGGGIFACQYYLKNCQVEGHRSALSVFATVIGRPAPDRAILDIGHKSISEYKNTPVVKDHPGCRVLGLSAEHTTVEVGPEASLKIGEKVFVVPGYSDFTFVLHDRVLGHRQGRIEASWDLLGRGKLQ